MTWKQHSSGSSAYTSSRIPKADGTARPTAPRSRCRSRIAGLWRRSRRLHRNLLPARRRSVLRLPPSALATRSGTSTPARASSSMSSNPAAQYSELLLGSDAQSGEQFQAVVPAGCWFGSSLRHPDAYALVGCTVAPGFDFADFEMANRDELIAQYPQHRGSSSAHARKETDHPDERRLSRCVVQITPRKSKCERPKEANPTKRAAALLPVRPAPTPPAAPPPDSPKPHDAPADNSPAAPPPPSNSDTPSSVGTSHAFT